MAVAILDTNVYIDHWERGLYQDTLENLRRAYIIRHSAVVLSELRRGARGRDAELLVASLFELATVRWEPSVADCGRQAGLSEVSVISKTGIYTSAETFKTMR